MDCKDILDKVRTCNSDLTLGEVCIASSTQCNLVSTLSPTTCAYGRLGILNVEGITMDAQTLLFFSRCVEISLIRCNLEAHSNSEFNALEFPNLSKFVYTEQPGRSASSRVGNALVKKAAQSEKLRVLHVGLSGFSALEAAASGWKAMHLEDLQVMSTGSYSASLQQLKYAPIIANVCHLCRASLERISLPSSILIKRFFMQLISTNSHFQKLQTLHMTGTADTKMFLPPGNLVETFSYQEFLKLCPLISSLSLHPFTGSLKTLMLSPALTELTLPWDNRMDLEKQRSEVVSTLSLLPQMHTLSILGVEEVDGTLGRRSLEVRRPPVLEISSKTLELFRVANACVRAISLRECTELHSFSIQCCPWLQDIDIPVLSLKKVCIYDEYSSYIDKFISYFMASRSKQSIAPTCHLHLQLHSLLNQEADNMPMEHKSKASSLFSTIEKTCEAHRGLLDCLILKDNTMHLFEHNSGEHMYPFTEFQSGLASGRSDTEVRTEVSRRERVFEGLNRWQQCLLKVKDQYSAEMKNGSQLVTSDVTYCEGSFKCATNLAYLETLILSPYICQPSGLRNRTPRSTAQDTVVDFNVPRIPPGHHAVSFDTEWDINSNPLIIISVMEYAHNIYTLFYYD